MKLFAGVFASGFILILLLYFSGIIDSNLFESAFYALILNLINSATALILFAISKNKNNQIFFLANMGGIGIRLFFLLIAIVILIKFLIIDLYGFILVFFIFYFILLSSEIWYFSKFMKKR